ncbi:MAG: hypothetical protein Q8J65_05120 [Nitrosomonadales bacterium]|nr:hypothetical protein [Nitrosomonadales bacterium]
MTVDIRQSMYMAVLALACMMLNGCFGAPFAQQLLSSAVMHGTDNLLSNAYEAQQRDALNQRVLKDSLPDEYWASFVTAGFQKVKPIEEPLPAIEQAPMDASAESGLETSALVRVEIWNMLIGDEKLAVLEKAYASGDKDLPPKEEWSKLRVAIGAQEGSKDQPLVFLIPDDLGRLNSGQLTIVELGGEGELNIARYATN